MVAIWVEQNGKAAVASDVPYTLWFHRQEGTRLMAVKNPNKRPKRAVKPKKGPKVPSQAKNRANPYRAGRRRSGV